MKVKKTDLSAELRMTLLLLMAAFTLAGCSDSNSGAAVGNPFPFPELVSVPAGTFMMGYGTGASGPAHLVEITDDYDIGMYEVTNEEYCAMLNYAYNMGYLAGEFFNNVSVKNRFGDSQHLLILDEDIEDITSPIVFHPELDMFVVRSGWERKPVIYVTWYGAAFYANIISEVEGIGELYDMNTWELNLDPLRPGYRLPTEAEWEYAARWDADLGNENPDRRALPWEPLLTYLPDTEELQQYANYNYPGGTGAGPMDVGSYENGRSGLGIYDMAGNVSEWIQDFYAPYNDEFQTNPVNNSSGIYYQRRGGGWLAYANNFLWTTYHTDTNYPYVYYVDFGFRVVRSMTKLNPIVF